MCGFSPVVGRVPSDRAAPTSSQPLSRALVTRMRDFAVISWADLYAGEWLVVRLRDRRLMTQSASVRECLRWIETWGGIQGQTKRGSELSPEAASRLAFDTKAQGC